MHVHDGFSDPVGLELEFNRKLLFLGKCRFRDPISFIVCDLILKSRIGHTVTSTRQLIGKIRNEVSR